MTYLDWIRAIVVLMGIYSSKSFQLMPIESKYPWEVVSVPKNSNTCILEKPSGNKWYFSVLILKRILKNMNDKNQLQGQSLKLNWSFGMLNVGICRYVQDCVLYLRYQLLDTHIMNWILYDDINLCMLKSEWNLWMKNVGCSVSNSIAGLVTIITILILTL